MITKIVADNWLDSRAKYIETKNLKRKRRSLTWISLLPLLQKCVIMYYPDTGCCEIDVEKYHEIRKELLND